MLKVVHDVSEHASNRARDELPTAGWRKPSHGHGMLKNFQTGNQLGGRRGTRFTETQKFAREHSMEALQALVERLHDPDGRIVVVAANSILERAWGRAREQKPEEQEQARIDLSKLSSAELGVLMGLVASGRLVAAPDAPLESGEADQVIEGEVSSDR